MPNTLREAPIAYVLLSGGIDSTTCLYAALRDFEGPENVIAVSVNYGQRHLKEIQYAAAICERIRVEHRVINLQLPDTMLTDPLKKIPLVSYADLPEGVSPTYVPFRNGNLLSQIVALASTNPRAKAVYFGAHAEDAQNWAYPDCTPEFIGAMANAIYIGTYHQVRLHTPIMWLFKHEVITWGERLGVPWQLTWSCYKGEELHCGVCPTCRSRRDAFLKARISDPTEYAATPDKEVPNV